MNSNLEPSGKESLPKPIGVMLSLAIGLGLAGTSPIAPAQTLYLNAAAQYGRPENVHHKIRGECKPELILPKVFREEVLGRSTFQDVVLQESANESKNALTATLTIVRLVIPPGTGWNTATRSLTVRTVMHRDDQLVADIEVSGQRRGSDTFAQKLLRIRHSCDFAEQLIRDVTIQSIERLKLIKALPARNSE